MTYQQLKKRLVTAEGWLRITWSHLMTYACDNEAYFCVIEVLTDNVLLKPQTSMINTQCIFVFYTGTEVPKLTYFMHNHTATTSKHMYFQGLHSPYCCCWWDECTVWEFQTGNLSSLQKKSPWFFFHWLGGNDPRRDFTFAFILVAQKTELVTSSVAPWESMALGYIVPAEELELK